MSLTISWISEQEAAEKLGRKPRTIRKKIKSRVWPIAYTAIEGRKFQYSERDIQRFLMKNKVG